MWNAIAADIKDVWGYCYGFEQVHDAASFAAYMKKCQLTAALFFVGANDEMWAITPDGKRKWGRGNGDIESSAAIAAFALLAAAEIS